VSVKYQSAKHDHPISYHHSLDSFVTCSTVSMQGLKEHNSLSLFVMLHLIYRTWGANRYCYRWMHDQPTKIERKGGATEIKP